MSELDSVKEACKLLEDIEAVRGEEEGKVTRSFLRKAFEMLDEAKSGEEYVISVGYMVARKKGEDNINFYKRLKELVEKIDKDKKNWNEMRIELKNIFEYVIKLYHIRAELGEDLCTKL